MNWRLRYLWREALRNAFTTPRGAAAILVGGLLAIAGVVLLRADLSTFEAAQQARFMRGTQVFTIAAPRQDASLQLRRSSCEHVASDPRVVRAGGLEDRGSEYIAQLGRRAQVIAASAALIPEAYETGTAIGEHLAAGTAVNLRIGERTVRAITMPVLPEGVDLNSAVVFSLAPHDEWVTSCLVVARPGADMEELAASALATTQTRGGADPAVFFADQDAEDHVDAFAHRATPVVLIIGGLGAGLVLAVLIRTRRAEFAVYRLAGTSGREVAVIVTMECAAASAAYALCGITGAVALDGFSVTAVSHALVLSSAATVMFAAGGLLGSLELRGDPTRMLADR